MKISIRLFRIFLILFHSIPLTLESPLKAASLETVLNWNESFIAGMRRDTLSPPIIARNLAVLHLALHRSHVQNPDCSDALTSLVAFKVCSGLLPAQTLFFENTLNTRYPGRILDADRIFADQIAAPLLEKFGRDRSSLHVTYVTRSAPGIWNRTAPFFREPELPHWPKVTPILLKEASQFRPKGPPSLQSEEYAKAILELKDWGGRQSSKRSEEQAQIARFWADFSYTETPVGHWNSITRVVLKDRKATGKDAARLFSDLNVAMADASIACWEAKYHFDFWRPITAIHRAAEDGNPHTEPDPDWTPFLNTPNHPEYVSGHSSYSAAACRILSHFLKTEDISFAISNDTLPGVVRKFTNLRACAKECGESRIFGGIHYRFSCDDGLQLGETVANWVLQHARSLDR